MAVRDERGRRHEASPSTRVALGARRAERSGRRERVRAARERAHEVVCERVVRGVPWRIWVCTCASLARGQAQCGAPRGVGAGDARPPRARGGRGPGRRGRRWGRGARVVRCGRGRALGERHHKAVRRALWLGRVARAPAAVAVAAAVLAVAPVRVRVPVAAPRRRCGRGSCGSGAAGVARHKVGAVAVHRVHLQRVRVRLGAMQQWGRTKKGGSCCGCCCGGDGEHGGFEK